MDVRIWGVVEDRLIEICVRRRDDEGGLWIEGLPEDRLRTTADRIRAALVNSALVREDPAAVIRLDPPVGGGGTSDLDLSLALAVLPSTGGIGAGLRSIVATGRLGLDGAVFAKDLPEALTLRDVVDSLSCQTPHLEFEHVSTLRISDE